MPITKKQVEIIENRLKEAKKLCEGTSCSYKVDEAYKAFDEKNYQQSLSILSSLPDYEKLFDSLIEKLKGKSVYSTLKLLESGKTDNSYTALKGMFSLCTHACIEMEKNSSSEYALLIEKIYKTIGTVLKIGERKIV
jgi:hypothetical protein